jgi:glycosyltransferase involved in cell wall biosynthesis
MGLSVNRIVKNALQNYAFAGYLEWLLSPIYTFRSYSLNRNLVGVIDVRSRQLHDLNNENFELSINPRQIVILCRGLFKMNPSGISNILWLIGNSLAQSGHKVTFVYEGKDVSKYFEKVPNITFQSRAFLLSFKKGSAPHFLQSWCNFVSTLFYSQKEDVICISTIAGFEGLEVPARVKQLVFLVTNYSLVEKSSGVNSTERVRVISKIEREFLQRENITPVADSNSILNDLALELDLPEIYLKSKVCPLFWTSSPQINTKSNLITFLGRIEKRKGASILIMAWRLIPPEKRVGWKLLLMGPAGDDIQALTMLSEFDPTISWLGQVSEAEKNSSLASTKIFVQPSKFESFGLTTIEAMHHGCAIVAAESAVNSEVVGDGVFYSANSPDLLAKQLYSLIENPKSISTSGAKMLDRAKSQYSPATFVQHFGPTLEAF